MEEDKIKMEIKAAIDSTTFNRSLLTALLNSIAVNEKKKGEAKPKKPQGGPCTVYKSIKRNYTCLHCGNKFSSVVDLKQGESVASMSLTGKVILITSDGPAEIEVATSQCKWCPQFIQTMDRTELEQRYMSMLRECRFKTNFAQNLTIEKVTISI